MNTSKDIPLFVDDDNNSLMTLSSFLFYFSLNQFHDDIYSTKEEEEEVFRSFSDVLNMMMVLLFELHYCNLLESKTNERTNERKDKKKKEGGENEWHNKRMTARRALANPIPAAHADECANE